MFGRRLTKAPDKRAIVDNANRTAAAAQLALELTTKFMGLGFFGRLWWLMTGQVGFHPLERAKRRLAAYRSRRRAPVETPSEGAAA